MHSRFRFLQIVCLLIAMTPSSALSQSNADTTAEDQTAIDFTRDVFPVLEKYCIGCHNSDDKQGGLAMDQFAGLVSGGRSGVAFTAGVPASSRMLLMISGKLQPAMPPDDAEGPTESEFELLQRWVESGAAGPDGELPIRRTLMTPKIDVVPGVAHPVTAIAVSNDGGLTAKATFARIEITGADDQRVEITDEGLGKVNSLSFSGDGERLLVASGLTGAFGRAAIYRSKNGELIREFVGHRDTLYAATFSPDESLIATAGYDQKILLWDVDSGRSTMELAGHNGAIFDLAFSPDGKVLVSACADETVKVWNVSQGLRLDTLSQPEGEVYAVSVTRDGQFIVACSADNRLRVWRLRSTDAPRINPLIATRFLDETAINCFAFSPDGRLLVAISQSGNVKLVRTSDWQPLASLEPLSESGTDLFVSRDNRSAMIASMDGQIVTRMLPEIDDSPSMPVTSQESTVLMDLGATKTVEESQWTTEVQPNADPIRDVDRNVTINGQISEPYQTDQYRWYAGRGEVWAIDADANGRMDPIVTVLDASDEPVLRVRLQAVRDSYFTFRGKDSDQSNDFRVFNWQEMNLGEYLYASGEVTRLHMHPRGPDSGFDMYPGAGTRWTYFGTSGTTHALGEPAYVVRPLEPEAEPLANGLPVFDVVYQNDDDPQRIAGKNSRLLFTAPYDGLFTVRIADTRGEGGAEYSYQLSIRAARPGFIASTKTISKPLHPGTGREFDVQVDRVDGYEGPVTFEITGLPERLTSNFPVTIEAGQRFASAMVWADVNEKGWDSAIEPTLIAWAMIDGRRVERSVGSIGKLTFDPAPAVVVPIIKPANSEIGEHENWTLQVGRGQTVSARVLVQRQANFKNEVSFGKERSGRNAAQGVYVDNIGLNGLLIVADADEREFFVTADPTAALGARQFFLTAELDGGLTSHPITVEVTP